MNDVAAIIPSSWHIFGICLRIDNEKLKAVELQNHGDPLLCFADVYSIWRQENYRPVTWTVVIEILQKNLLKKMTLSHELRRKYCLV